MNLLKKLLAILLSLEVTMSAGALVGCTPNNQDSSNPGGGYEQPLPGEENKFSSHSKILQKVLTDETYINIARSPTYFQEPYWSPLPMAFLQDKGYNLTDIKRGIIPSSYCIFNKNNDLYVACKILNKSTIEYNDDYLLKYTLTDQELNDFNILCRTGINNKKYVQAGLFIQELSYTKTPTVLSETHIATSVEEILKDANKELMGNYKYIIYNGESANDESDLVNDYTFTTIPYFTSSSVRSERKLSHFTSMKKPCITIVDNKEVLNTPNPTFANPIYFTKDLVQENVLLYDLRDSYLNILDYIDNIDEIKKS